MIEMRLEGTITVYIIEIWLKSKHDDRPGYWSGPCHDGIYRAINEHSETAPIFPSERAYQHKDCFTASGECWQRHYIHGVFDEENALRIIPLLRKHHPNERYRLAKKTITMHTVTEEIASVGAEAA